MKKITTKEALGNELILDMKVICTPDSLTYRYMNIAEQTTIPISGGSVTCWKLTRGVIEYLRFVCGKKGDI